jgi:hypothetical protein
MVDLSLPSDMLFGFVGERVFAGRSVRGPVDVALEGDIVNGAIVMSYNCAVCAFNTAFD